jgi:hypothetical protein
MMFKRTLLTLVWITTAFTGYTQTATPQGLMCDLLAHTDRQSQFGYPVQPVWTKEGFLAGQSVRIANRRPAFSWALQGAAGARQSAYRVVVMQGKDIVWDSRKVASGAAAGIEYAGQALQPNTLYTWQVQVWDGEDSAGELCAPAAFFTDSVLTDYATARYPLQKTDQRPHSLQKAAGVYRIDFGKAAFGQLRLQLSTLKENDTVTVHLGEAISADGRINRKPGGTIRYQAYRLPLQPGTHSYQVRIRPDARNTGPQAIKMPDYIGEVLPFRYVEVEGYAGELKTPDAVRMAVNYPFNDEAAVFESSDTVLNAVWDLCKYSMKATSFAGVYVDGDRERIPYEADAYINQLGHYATDREFSLARYSHEYLLHHATWPTEWILQSVLMAWHDYLYTGDIRSARHFYTDLQAKLLMPLEGPKGLISTRIAPQDKSLLQSVHFNGNALRDIVDWPHTGILGLGKAEGGETDGFVFNNYNAVVNAYYYKALSDMERMALALDKKEDAARFGKKAAAVKTAFRKTFWDGQRKVFRDGDSTTHASLHANMFALAFGLAEPADHKAVADFIRSRGMACSVYGSQFLMDAVYDGEDEDYGLALLRSTEERSWYNMIRAGSTIAMEAWDNKYKPNQDWNHAWGAVPANIIPRKLMGIEPLAPGFSVFSVRPQPGNLASAKLRLPTVKGEIRVAYEQQAGSLRMQLHVPANTTARVALPAKYRKKGVSVTWNGKPVKSGGKPGSYLLPEIPSGDHELIVSSQ